MKTNFEFPVLKVTIIAMLLVKTFLLAAQHPILGTTDIKAFVKEVPGLPKSTDEAMKRAGNHPAQPDHGAIDRFYKPFENKVGNRIADYQLFAKQKMEAGGATQADYQKAAEVMANGNPVVAGMGGYEKVSQMTEDEARLAAMRAAEVHKADPFAANGVQSAGMTALYQKIMSDPAYAKKFEKMSDAEKEAELRKYMANDAPVALSPAQQQARASQQIHADRVRHAQEVQLRIAELNQQIADVTAAFGQKLEDIRQHGHTHEAIAKEAGRRYDAIPMVELGEYGRDHDPEKVKALRIEEAKQHRERAMQELKAQTVAFSEVRDAYLAVVAEGLDFVKKNLPNLYDGTSAKDMMEATNTEQPLLMFEASLLNVALELSIHSRELTKAAAGWEANFTQTMQTYR